MKVKEILDFYFSKYEEINVRMEMAEGIEGRSHLCHRNDLSSFEPWYDNEVLTISCQTHYIHIREDRGILKYPHLYILYKNIGLE